MTKIRSPAYSCIYRKSPDFRIAESVRLCPSSKFQSNLKLNHSQILYCMTYLIARIETNEAQMPIAIGIYSKDAIDGISYKLVEVFNFLVQNSEFRRNKWRSHRLDKFMSMFDGTCESLVWVFIYYLFENAGWNRFEISP